LLPKLSRNQALRLCRQLHQNCFSPGSHDQLTTPRIRKAMRTVLRKQGRGRCNDLPYSSS
jgi:hypothetical protein